MRHLKTLAATVLVASAATLAAPTDANAQSQCNSAVKVLDAIWQRWGERIKAKKCGTSAECLANAQKKEELVREMIAFWNEQAQGSWATIGPRELSAVNDGKVIAGTSRLFVSQSVLDGDKYEIVVEKQGGGAADVTASLYDGKTCIPMKSVSFDKDDKPGTKKTIVVEKALGLEAMVKVDAKNTNAFDYRFTFAKKG